MYVVRKVTARNDSRSMSCVFSVFLLTPAEK